jgi:hypothetical protein
MSLLVLDAALGILLITAVVVSRRLRRQDAGHVRAIGWGLVAIPLPLAVALHVFRTLPTASDQTLFFTGIVAFAIGSALLLGSRDDGDWREQGDDSPPWWPEFEREFRRYSQRPRVRADQHQRGPRVLS